MKKYIFLIAITALIFSGCKKDDDEVSSSVTVKMGNQYINDVYYSFNTGVVKTVDKSTWDIAFSAPLQTASIIINEGAGVELYCAGDTNAWVTTDSSDLYNLKPRYNDKTDWLKGAFNQNSSTQMNFGWGTYNMSTHNVYGDSIYIIKLSNGSIKKLWIKNRMGYTNSYVLCWADADGSNEETRSFPVPSNSTAKHFLHFSLITKQFIDVEPDKTSWDLLFTNYITKVSMGAASNVNYLVMGILANQDVKLAKAIDVDPATVTLSDTTTGFCTQSDLIGWDWKVNDPETHEYSLVSNSCYFVKQSGGTVYKIYFTDFGGSSTGNVSFMTQIME